jgi:hypothetical protein
VRWSWYLLVACGCSHEARPDVEPDAEADAPLAVLSFDVTVTPRVVTLYPNGPVPPCSCDDEGAHFPALDACIDHNDVACACEQPWCLNVELTGTGVAPRPPTLDFPSAVRMPLPDPFPADLVLHVSGCGHPELAIPIEPFSAPTPTITVDVADTSVTARWQTDQPAASAYVVWSGFNLGFRDCHTTANELSYDRGTSGGTNPTLGVTTFVPVQTVTTPQREIRIWRGNEVYVRL